MSFLDNVRSLLCLPSILRQFPLPPSVPPQLGVKPLVEDLAHWPMWKSNRQTGVLAQRSHHLSHPAAPKSDSF